MHRVFFQAWLYRVLRAYAALDPEVGYCQGMSFVAGAVVAVALAALEGPGANTIGNAPPAPPPPADGFAHLSERCSAAEIEERAFWTFACLMTREVGDSALRQCFVPGMLLLQRRLLVLDELIGRCNKPLAAHLAKHGIEPALFATPWFNTLFLYSMPFGHALRVLDVYTYEGEKMLFRTALVLLRTSQPALLQCRGMEALAAALRDAPALCPLVAGPPDRLMVRVLSTRVGRALAAMEGRRRSWLLRCV